MTEIVWDQCLERKGLLLFINVVKKGPNHFTFLEGEPLPPDVAGVKPKDFESKEQAMIYVEENYLPGRRTFGWKLTLPPFPVDSK
jgi:hypothetical protein